MAARSGPRASPARAYAGSGTRCFSRFRERDAPGGDLATGKFWVLNQLRGMVVAGRFRNGASCCGVCRDGGNFLDGMGILPRLPIVDSLFVLIRFLLR